MSPDNQHQAKQPAMQVIKYSDLSNSTKPALEALRTAATADGFFMLELDSNKDDDLLSTMAYLESFARQVFETPAEIRKRYRSADLGPFRLSGFKEVGTVEGAKKGQPDGFEMCIHQDEILSGLDDTELKCPPLVVSNRHTLSSCLEKYAALSELLLITLAQAMDLNDTILAAHDTKLPTATNFSFLRYPAQPNDKSKCGHIAHTDVGSLTILYTTSRGLQIIDNATQDWKYIDIPSTCLCVQVGDALKYLSGGVMVPSLHRVIPDDASNQVDRYSMVYFLRPNLDAKITREDGTSCLYRDYHGNKIGAFMSSKGEILSARQHKVLVEDSM